MAEDHQTTLFVRNLPYTTTNETLEQIFGEVGPIKSCFVVKDRDSGKCRGFGYVKYSVRDDAETAKNTIQSIEGRKLVIHYADKKPREKEKKKKKKILAPLADNDSDDEDEDEGKKVPKMSKDLTEVKQIKEEPKERETESKSESTSPKLVIKDTNSLIKEKRRAACTVIVKNFNATSFESDVRSILVGQKNQRKVVYPVVGREETLAEVLFKSKRDAQKAAKRLDKTKVKGSQISAQLLSIEQSMAKSPKQPKKCRLIIRNLSFKCNDAKLKDAFVKFGEITEVTVPKKPDGRMLGFGFVQFSTMSAVNTAMAQMNAKPLLGRPIAVDWALSKKKFEEIAVKDIPADSSDSGSYSSEGEAAAAESGSDTSEEEEEAEQEEDVEMEEEKAENISTDEQDSSSEESDDESTETDSEASEDDSAIKAKVRGNDDKSSEDEGFTDEDSEDEDDEEDSEEDDGESSEESSKQDTKITRKSDVDQGKTLFIRNLSYDTEEDDLGELFEEYGEVKYCRIVVDPATERSRGTAFIQFKQKTDAEKVLEAADPDKGAGITLDNRRLNISPALSHDHAVKLQAAKKKKEVKDNRNLYLAREGLIRAGTKDAEGLSQVDLNKRNKVEAMKRQKLKNPNIFISDTRLCLHNIPVSVDDNELRKVITKYLPNKSARITECRIMKDMARVNSQGVAKSRGYGFVDFNDHKHALQVLRKVNNNPQVFGETRRLIVEFSLENRMALATKERRLERAKAKQETFKKGKNNFVEAKSRKKNKPDDRNRPTAAQAAKMSIEDLDAPEKKGPKGLPSHWGPKIRHRDRNKNEKVTSRAKVKRDQKRQEQDISRKRKLEHGTQPNKPKKRTKRPEIRDNLDDLVNKYRNQFSKTFNKAKSSDKKSKWFDS